MVHNALAGLHYTSTIITRATHRAGVTDGSSGGAHKKGAIERLAALQERGVWVGGLVRRGHRGERVAL